jgi:hypothetical protein
MHSIIVASTRRSAGKTSLIIGLATALGIGIGYAKPFGDRLLYRKKRLWDYDAALVTAVLDIEQDPQEMTIGFDHSKLRFMYDEAATATKLREIADANRGQALTLFEAGSDFAFGTSVHLDPISVARHVGGQLLIVLSGDGGSVVDDALFIRRSIEMSGVPLVGAIVNQVRDVNDFQATYLDEFVKAGMPVLGVVPYAPELTRVSMDYLAEHLFAKVIAGDGGLSNVVENVLVGAMSTNEVLRSPVFSRPRKLVITSGDRSDMILAALETDAAGVVLSNNILPPPNIMSKANDLGIPLLQVPEDTFRVAKKIDDMEPLLTKNNTDKIALLTRFALEHVDLDALTSRIGL